MFSWLGRRIVLTGLRLNFAPAILRRHTRMVGPRYPTESENSAEWSVAFI